MKIKKNITMKTQTKITDITHDDLVNLFSGATYGSEWLTIGTPRGFYKGTELEDENDCREDVWAKVLLAGKNLYFYDYNAEDEDEFYGNLTHLWRDDNMRYEFTLDDIEKGIAKCLDLGGWISDCALHLVFSPENLDLYEAEAIMQVIVFGELIYG